MPEYPDTKNTVRLWVNGQEFGGWKSVRIAAGIERLARDFEVSVTDKWPGQTQARLIKPGDFVRVLIGQDVVLTGYVDATPIEYDARGYTIIIRGRSKTADLIDSAPDNDAQQWIDSKAEKIIGDLAEPYGVEVITQATTGEAIKEHQIQQGETIRESLERIAKQRQVLMTDDEKGRLVIVKTGGGGQASDALILGKNILSGMAGFDFTEIYSDYTVKGQRSGDDESFGEAVSQGIGRARDGDLKRKRVLIVRQPGQADDATLQQRASYEQQVRRARATEARYKVAGWRQSSGQLWTINQTVSIQDAMMGLDGSLLISEVNFYLNESGMITELVCIDQNAFLTEPQQAEQKTESNDVEWVAIPGASSTGSTTGTSTPKDQPTWVDIDKATRQ